MDVGPLFIQMQEDSLMSLSADKSISVYVWLEWVADKLKNLPGEGSEDEKKVTSKATPSAILSVIGMQRSKYKALSFAWTSSPGII